MDKKKPFSFGNFSGGYCANLAHTQLQPNQSADCDNIVIGINGLGFRTRLGNVKLNATALNSGAPIQGMNYFIRSATGDIWLTAVAGTKFLVDTQATGTFTDVTGTTITSGANNLWDIVTFGDAVVAFGGPPTNPDAPFTWNNGGASTLLTGTPPVAYGAFTANNRMFAFRTAANMSTIYWSVLANAADWTGTGSGSATVGSLNDNQKVTAAAVLSTNYALLFKENSTYQMILSTAPFPIYTLYDKVGCVGKKAVVNVDGEVYWITSQKEMKSSIGQEMKDYPKNADDLWGSVTTSSLPYTTGFRQKGSGYDWLVWIVTISSVKQAIIWDLLNKCWLYCSTGYKMLTATEGAAGLVYVGGSTGFIYKLDQAATYADASETSPGTISGHWRSGWLNPAVLDEIVQVTKVTIIMGARSTGTLSFAYGFNFLPTTKNVTVAQQPVATETITSATIFTTGRGNVFQWQVTHDSSTIDMTIESVLLRGKATGQKRLSAS